MPSLPASALPLLPACLAPFRAIRVLLALVAAALALSGCGPEAPKFKGSDVTGSAFGRDFSLVDFDGKSRTLADYRGKAVVLFFGYTQCPDVCPTTLLKYKRVRELLGADADRLQVIYVSIDPERDTAEVLRGYMPLFHPSFVGLRGDARETAAAAKAFKVVYEKVPGPTPTSYAMNHSTFAFALDREGRVRLMIPHALEAARVAEDLRALLSSP